ncbi:LPXTG cell wall anchor domain-containing protein [Enterococcus raffinosus]|uniref:LPXTG cell wall anchor domain-containing protein n=1 Tax=Enterococcus raffinosus TaxID=71452 RepID=UPI001C11D1BB|nr:LPXTG cell wall anchor domain-containing protein [Enterococcus raffinosus]MBU5362412.1 LPXTG cell wall anchor domain-containing protein [Enterococcus raffinosus]
MKKIVLFSLLVLIFPAAALADTSENISDEMTTLDQELIVESTSIPEDSANESQAPTASETQTSDEPTVESEVAIPEETPSIDNVSTDEAMSATDEALTDSTTTESTTSNSENLEEKTTISPAVVANRALSAAPKKIDPKEIAEKTKPVLNFQEEYLIVEWIYPWQIREILTKSKFKIDPSELSGYTDQELENAFKLFANYSDDIMFMDWSAYVHVLQMVYRDKVISWSDVEKALSFNSIFYDTTDELAKDIDKLQTYLQVLYSSKEGLLQIRPFTNEELLQILNDLSGYEEELSKKHSLFSGILHWLYNSQEENAIRPVTPIFSLSTSLNSVVGNSASIPRTNSIPVNMQNNNAQMKATAQKEYPRTGEKNTLALSIIGITCLFISGFILLERRFRI